MDPVWQRLDSGKTARSDASSVIALHLQKQKDVISLIICIGGRPLKIEFFAQESIFQRMDLVWQRLDSGKTTRSDASSIKALYLHKQKDVISLITSRTPGQRTRNISPCKSNLYWQTSRRLISYTFVSLKNQWLGARSQPLWDSVSGTSYESTDTPCNPVDGSKMHMAYPFWYLVQWWECKVPTNNIFCIWVSHRICRYPTWPCRWSSRAPRCTWPTPFGPWCQWWGC